MDQNKRGGAREGAGRKGQGKKKLSIRLSPEIYEKIEKFSEIYKISKTEVIEKALNLTQNLDVFDNQQ